MLTMLLRVDQQSRQYAVIPPLMLRVPLQARRMDHFERAKREEEAPLILAAHTQRLQVRKLMLDFRSDGPSTVGPVRKLIWKPAPPHFRLASGASTVSWQTARQITVAGLAMGRE